MIIQGGSLLGSLAQYSLKSRVLAKSVNTTSLDAYVKELGEREIDKPKFYSKFRVKIRWLGTTL